MVHIQVVGIERVRCSGGTLQLVGVIQHTDGGSIQFTWDVENAETVACMILATAAFARTKETQLCAQDEQAMEFGDDLPKIAEA